MTEAERILWRPVWALWGVAEPTDEQLAEYAADWERRKHIPAIVQGQRMRRARRLKARRDAEKRTRQAGQ